MSAISNDVRTEPLFSRRVSGEKRSFYFDVRRSQERGAYLTISQFVKLADEWVRLKLVVPSEDVRTFYQGLCEAIKALRAAETEPEAPKVEPKSARPNRERVRA